MFYILASLAFSFKYEYVLLLLCGLHFKIHTYAYVLF